MGFDPNIFLRGSEQSVQMSRDLTDNLIGAINTFQQRKALEEERARQERELQAKQAMDLDYIRRQEQMGIPLLPEQEAALRVDIAQRMSEVAVDPVTGEPYRKYQPVGGDARFAPSSAFNTLSQAGAGQLLPPPQQVVGQSMEQDMPTPIGQEGVTARDLVPSGATPRTRQKAQEAAVDVRKEEFIKNRERKLAKEENKKTASQSFKLLLGDVENIEKTANYAIDKSSGWNTGIMSGGAPKEGEVAGAGFTRLGYLTGAVDLASTLKTVQADAAFGALQAMRTHPDNKTGGALGQVSERELALLQNAKSALDQAQSEKQLDQNLQNYIKTRQRALKNVAEAYKETYGGYPSGYNPKQFKDVDINFMPLMQGNRGAREGSIIQNKQGQRMILKGGQWQPL